MWYVYADNDDEVFDRAFLVRLEIRVLLDEIRARNARFELAGEPGRLRSNFVNGLESMPVRVVRR